MTDKNNLGQFGEAPQQGTGGGRREAGRGAGLAALLSPHTQGRGRKAWQDPLDRATDSGASGEEQRKGHMGPVLPRGLFRAPLCCSLRVRVRACVHVCVSVCAPGSASLSLCVLLSPTASFHPTLSSPHPGPAVTLDRVPGRLGHRTRPPRPLAVPIAGKWAGPTPYNQGIQTAWAAWGQATFHNSPTSPANCRVRAPCICFWS